MRSEFSFFTDKVPLLVRVQILGAGRRGERERERERQTDRQAGRQAQTHREKSNSNSKTLILKDSSVRSFWIYLTASPCYTTNTNKHDNTTNKCCKHE